MTGTLHIEDIFFERLDEESFTSRRLDPLHIFLISFMVAFDLLRLSTPLKILCFLSPLALIKLETFLFGLVLLIRKVNLLILNNLLLLFLHSYGALVNLTPVRPNKGLIPSAEDSVNSVAALQKIHFDSMRVSDLH